MSKYIHLAEAEQTYVDQETGEIIWFNAALADKRSARRKPLNQQDKNPEKLPAEVTSVTPRGNSDERLFWIRADREFHERMLHLDLPRRPRRVLDAMMVLAKFGNYVTAQLEDLSRMTGIAKPHVSSAIKVLVHEDLVAKLGAGKYMVNPFYCFMGDADSRSKSMAIYFEARRKARAEAASKARKHAKSRA